MPRNKDGMPIDPTDMNRADGFSPGSAISRRCPGSTRPRRSSAASCRRSRPAARPRQELARRRDQRPHRQAASDLGRDRLERRRRRTDRVLIIRPARNLDEGERYIVALRNLTDASGKEIKPSRGFRIYRDRIKTGARPIERRRQRFERIFER